MPTLAPHATAPIHYTLVDAPLGRVLIARGDDGVRAVLLGDDDGALRDELRTRLPDAPLMVDDAGLAATAACVLATIAGTAGDAAVPLALHGTAFQRRVWQALRELPTGSTVSYAAVAARIGAPGAARAVARACAANAHAVLVPCHRVVRADGRPSGYRWGATRRQVLLAQEAVHAGRASAPNPVRSR